VLGVPLDLGQSRRGVDMGPSAVRVAGLEAKLEALGHIVEDGGNISVAVRETKQAGDDNARYLKEITSTCTKLAEQVVATLAAGQTPLVFGGDHSIAVGTVSGVSEFYRQQGKKIGLLWIDAHADMNTPETSPSGNVHGMPLAALLGLGPNALGRILNGETKVAPENCVIIGVRDIDATPAPACRRSTRCATLTSAACAP
jgi:arginase